MVNLHPLRQGGGGGGGEQGGQRLQRQGAGNCYEPPPAGFNNNGFVFNNFEQQQPENYNNDILSECFSLFSMKMDGYLPNSLPKDSGYTLANALLFDAPPESNQGGLQHGSTPG